MVGLLNYKLQAMAYHQKIYNYRSVTPYIYNQFYGFDKIYLESEGEW